MSCLSAPGRCVSRVGTAKVLDYEKEEYEIRLVTNRLQEERSMKLVNPTTIPY